MARTGRAQLGGPFRLRLVDGTDITPGSQLRQAILAVLIAAPGQVKSRKSLQEMFWGSADSDRASASLRTAIYLLGRDLACLGEDTLRKDRQAISLAPERILSDPPLPGATFLEGLDLPLADCESFEDWLREKRAAQEVPDRPSGSEAAPAAPSANGRDAKSAPRLALGLLPPLHAKLGRADMVRADSIADAVARAISQTTTLDLHDLRGYDVQAVPLPIESGTGATHIAQALVERRGRKLLFTLRLHDVASRRLIWISETLDIAHAPPEELSCALAEPLLERMSRTPAGHDAPDLFPFTAITALFALDDDLTRRTQLQIDRMLEAGNAPVFTSLKLFAQVFTANEGLGASQTGSPEALCDTLSQLPTSHPMLPLCHSLAGYSAHMLWGENALAEQMLGAAYERAPHLALNLDHMAVLRLAQGDIPGAERALERCLHAGATSPWRYTYDVTGAMIAMAQGDFRRSLSFANRALMRKPRFIGALRYAMAGFALADNPRDAMLMKARITRLRPDYDFSGWTECMMRRTPAHLAQTLSQSFQAQGII